MTQLLGAIVVTVEGSAPLLVSGAVLLAVGVAALAASRLLEHGDPEWANAGGHLSSQIQVLSYVGAIAIAIAAAVSVAGVIKAGVPAAIVALAVLVIGAAVGMIAARRRRTIATRVDDALRAEPDRPWSARVRARRRS